MDMIQKVNDTVIASGGIAKTSDFVAQGIDAKRIAKLCKDGYLIRVRQGYYQLADGSFSTEEKFTDTSSPAFLLSEVSSELSSDSLSTTVVVLFAMISVMAASPTPSIDASFFPISV